MAMLDRAGVEIFYEVHGPATDPLPVLLTHGMAATSEMWNANMAALSQNRQIITWDIRGHGRSDSPDDQGQYSEALSVADMAAILDAVGVTQAVIGGLSLGGYLSLAFHLEHPDRVAALLLFDTGPGYKRDAARDLWNEEVESTAARLEQQGLEGISRSAEVRAATHRSIDGLIRARRGIMKQFDARVIESLPAIAVPTLVLVGADDKGFLAATDYMAAKIPAATKVVIDDAGHASNIDQPGAFNRAVLEFLEGL